MWIFSSDHVLGLLAGTPERMVEWSVYKGMVFVLDGVLIGAGDGRYLARTGLLVLLVFAPAAWAGVVLGESLVALWVAFALAFMGGRGVVLTHRQRGTAWMTLGGDAGSDGGGDPRPGK